MCRISLHVSDNIRVIHKKQMIFINAGKLGEKEQDSIMPMIDGDSKEAVSDNIAEFHQGKTYAKTKRKFGAKVANKQAVAASLSNARKSRTRKFSLSQKKTGSKR